MSDYNSSHSGLELDQAINAALHPEGSVKAGSTKLITSGVVAEALHDVDTQLESITTKNTQQDTSIATNASDIGGLKTRMTTAEGNVTSLGTRMTSAEGNIASLGTRMTTAEGSITTQKGRIDALALDASSVEGGVNVELKEVGGEVLTDVLIEPASLSSNGVMSKTQVKAISDNAGEIRTLKTRVTTAEGNITSLDNSLTEYVTDLTSAIEAVEAEYKAADTALGTRLTTAEGNIAEHTTKLSELQQTAVKAIDTTELSTSIETPLVATFNANETARQATFTTNEATRTATFNSNEATRNAANAAAIECADKLAELDTQINGGTEIVNYDITIFTIVGQLNNDGTINATQTNRKCTEHISLANVTGIECVCYKNQYSPAIIIADESGNVLHTYANPETGYLNGKFEITSIPESANYAIFCADIRDGGTTPYIKLTKETEREVAKKTDLVAYAKTEDVENKLNDKDITTYNDTWLNANCKADYIVDYRGFIISNTGGKVSNPIDVRGAVKVTACAIANAYVVWCALYDYNGQLLKTINSSTGDKNKIFELTDVEGASYIRINWDSRDGAPSPYVVVEKSTNNVSNVVELCKGNVTNIRKHDKAMRFAYFTDSHYCGSSMDWDSDGLTEDEKIAYLRDCILAENAKKPIDFCISTGDTLLVDKASEEHTTLSIGLEFKKIFIDKLPFPLFSCVGNHDGGLTDEEWRKVFGHTRQFSFETDTMYFICLDQMHHSDGTNAYLTTEEGTPKWHNVVLDYDYLDTEIAKAKSLNKDVVICFHFFYAMSVDDANAISTFYEYCHTKGVHLTLYGHQHGAECWNTKDNTNAANTYTDLYAINAGWFAHREPYPSSPQKWSFAIVEVEDGIMTATIYIVAHNYTSATAYPLGNVEASQTTKTIDTLQYYPIAKAQYQLWKFNNNCK